jgi:DNA-binding CsgD family transcriptional regulator
MRPSTYGRTRATVGVVHTTVRSSTVRDVPYVAFWLSTGWTRRQIYVFPRAQGGSYADWMERLTVTNQDMRRLEGLLDPSLPCEPEDDIAPGFLDALRDLIGCDDVTIQVMDLDRRSIRLQESSAEPELDPDLGAELERVFWEGFWDNLGCSYPQRTGDTRVTRGSDFSTADSPVSEYEEMIGCQAFEMLVPLPMPVSDGLDHRLLLFRNEGPDFTGRDVLLMELLRPHIIEMHARQLRHQRGEPDLTRRQWEILRLVATGCTNRQAASALRLSERTITKHLENIYLRLNVQSRTEAIRAAGIHTLVGQPARSPAVMA